jgi:uncharacterized protein YeaO (DUF488 family)
MPLPSTHYGAVGLLDVRPRLGDIRLGAALDISSVRSTATSDAGIISARRVAADTPLEGLPNMLKTKSFWSPVDRKTDGLRILATRFRGRGTGTEGYDVWMPSLAPSERLVKSFLAGTLPWPDFAREYRQELQMDGPVDARCATIKNHGQKFTLRLLHQLARTQNVTLLCLCDEDQSHCHRHVLLKEIERVGR